MEPYACSDIMFAGERAGIGGVGAELERTDVSAEVTGAKAKGTEAAEIMEGSNAQVPIEQRREQQCHFKVMNAPTQELIKHKLQGSNRDGIKIEIRENKETNTKTQRRVIIKDTKYKYREKKREKKEIQKNNFNPSGEKPIAVDNPGETLLGPDRATRTGGEYGLGSYYDDYVESDDDYPLVKCNLLEIRRCQEKTNKEKESKEEPHIHQQTQERPRTSNPAQNKEKGSKERHLTTKEPVPDQREQSTSEGLTPEEVECPGTDGKLTPQGREQLPAPLQQEEPLEQQDEHLLVQLQHEDYYRQVRMIYFSGFNPLHITEELEPRAPFAAAEASDKAISDSNWFAWWTERGYYYLETVRLCWQENGQDWTGKRIVMFKRRGLAKFRFQAGTDVIQAKDQLSAERQWFDLMRRFAETDKVLEIDMIGWRMTSDGITFTNMASPEESKQLAADYVSTLENLPQNTNFMEINMVGVNEVEFRPGDHRPSDPRPGRR